MAEPHIISALIRKRAELAGDLKLAEASITRLQAQISAMDTTLLTFDPDQRPAAIRAKVRRQTDSNFKAGELTRAVLSVLRHAEKPLGTRELAMQVAQAQGVDLPTQKARAAFVANVRSVLKKPREDVVAEPWKRGGFAWRMT